MKALLSVLLLTTVFYSCKKTELTISTISDPDLQAIDPATPKDAQPYIIDDTEPGRIQTSSAPSGYTLRWSDEFNSRTFDTNKWTKTNSTTSRDPRPDKGITSWYFKPEQVSLDGSCLVLSAQKISSSRMDCGAIDSKSKYMPKYGYFEVRVDNANIAKAVHTAFWLQGLNQGNVNGSGSDGCEVDVFESAFTKGEHTQTAFHWDGYGTNAQQLTRHWDKDGGSIGSNIHTGFHLIGLKWTSSELMVYYDGSWVGTFTGNVVPQVQEYIILSVGASFGDGDFSSQSLGSLTSAKFDYVRVYQWGN